MNDPEIQQWLPIPLIPSLVHDPDDPHRLRPEENALRAWREKVGKVWSQLAGKDTSEVQATGTLLQRQLEELKERLDSARVVRPKESDETGLPMRLKDWQALPRVERQRLYRKWNATYHEIQFKLGVTKNMMWRRSMFDDNRQWGDYSDSEDELTDEASPPDTRVKHKQNKEWETTSSLLSTARAFALRTWRRCSENIIRSGGKPQRLSYRMSKTGHPMDMRLVPPARKIAGHYLSTRNGGPEGWLFPILDDYDTSTEEKLVDAIGRQNALVNKHLKKIAAHAEIDVSLTSHVVRHSFASITLRRGWDVAEISERLGRSGGLEGNAALPEELRRCATGR